MAYKSIENIQFEAWRAKRVRNVEKILEDILVLHMLKILTDMKLEYKEEEETESL